VIAILEDCPMKARTIARIVRMVRPDLPIIRVSYLDPGLIQAADAVITDWHYPRELGGVPVESGAEALALAQARGVPVVVISGSLRPDHVPAEVWADDWTGAIRALLEEL
jgi:hypothetical protein